MMTTEEERQKAILHLNMVYHSRKKCEIKDMARMDILQQ